jgi:hypothetical protein
MQFSLSSIAALCACAPFLAVAICSEATAGRLLGGPCKYKAISGIATITDVNSAPADGYNCQDAVEVIFNFSPDDPSAIANYRFKKYPDADQRFTLGAGLNPPGQWSQRVGLVSGSSHRCIRNEIISGSCVPVHYVFPDLDIDGWEQECFKARTK